MFVEVNHVTNKGDLWEQSLKSSDSTNPQIVFKWRKFKTIVILIVISLLLVWVIVLLQVIQQKNG